MTGHGRTALAAMWPSCPFPTSAEGRRRPQGRLASTVYHANYTSTYRPNMTDYRLRGGPAVPSIGLPAAGGTTYMHVTDPVLWRFGHGLR